jgi:hypothetical protein
MVSSVSSLPYFSYLDQLQGKKNTVETTPTPAVTLSNAQTNSSSLVASLLGQGGFSPSVLSLLQENGSGSFDPIANMLGGKSVNNGMAKLYTNLYESSAASSLQLAKMNNPKSGAGLSSPSLDLIADSVKTTMAYNQTIQQNVANMLKESKIRTDAITSLVS